MIEMIIYEGDVVLWSGTTSTMPRVGDQIVVGYGAAPELRVVCHVTWDPRSNAVAVNVSKGGG